MTGWLPRSLVTMAVGGILAFGVTARVSHVDIQESGAIIFFAGLLYLLVHLGLYGWERGWGTPRRQPDSPAAPAYDAEPSPRLRPRSFPPPSSSWSPGTNAQRPAYPEESHGSAGSPDRPYGNQGAGSRPYANRAPRPDADMTRVMPVIDDEPSDDARDPGGTDTTAPIRRDRGPDPRGG